MRYLSLFSGIGGLDRAVETHFGAAPAAFVERDPYCKQVLAKRWPGVPIFDDVRQVGAGDVEPPDIVCGGSPCQDLSCSGGKAGLVDGDRSALFFEMARIVGEFGPRYVVIENVPALLKWRGTVERALEGYGLTWVKVSAAHVGAPHLRRRVFVLAERGAAPRGVVEAGKVQPAARWSTPNASDDRNRNATHTPSAKRRRDIGKQTNLSSQVGGARLSPAWVEILMGFPMGWTDLDCDNPIARPFPAPMVKGQWGDSPQHDFEPPRAVTGKQAHRTARLRALGNAVVSAQALQALALAVQGPRQSMLFGGLHRAEV